MTENQYPADGAGGTPGTHKAQAAASTAADEGKRVAGVAQGEAQKVASEASTQVRNVVGETQTQVGEQLSEQAKTQRDRLVGTLGSLTEELHSMADGNDKPGLATDLAREAAGHAGRLSDYLDGREPKQMIDDVRDFARRRPGTFLLGALAAGLVVGRVVRGAKDAGSDSGPAEPAHASFDNATLTAPNDENYAGLPSGPPPSAPPPPPLSTFTTPDAPGSL